MEQVTSTINETTLLVIMLETEEAISNAYDIAAIPGVDVLLVGSSDLCMDMGIPGQVDSPRLKEALKTVVDACKAHGKFAGLGGVYQPALMEEYIGLGMRMCWRQRSVLDDRRERTHRSFAGWMLHNDSESRLRTAKRRQNRGNGWHWPRPVVCDVAGRHGRRRHSRIGSRPPDSA